MSSSSANTCIYNYNYTNSSHTYVSTSKSFGNTSHRSAYISSRSSALHNAAPTGYTTNHHGTSYLNSHYANANYQQPLPSQLQTQVPQSIIFPELNNLTNEELKRLGEDDDKLDDFLEKHSQIKEINAAIEDAMDWVEKTAGKNKDILLKYYVKHLVFVYYFLPLSFVLYIYIKLSRFNQLSMSLYLFS